MSQYKYYFKKPRSEITKDILKGLALVGVVTLAGVFSPSAFARQFWKIVRNIDAEKGNKKKFYDTFYRLRKQGYVDITERNRQVYISLTAEGKKRAGRFQIDALRIAKPKKWDEKWRIVIFDIDDRRRVKREAFRGKLIDLGFVLLQESVWVYPYNCEDEIKLLQEFFGLTSKEICVIVAERIWDDEKLRKTFKFS